MNVTLNKIDEVNATLSVSIEAADYQEKVNEELKRARREASIPGFRKGQVPASIIAKRFRKPITSDVINHEVYEAVTKYLTDEKLNILGEPIPTNVTELDLDNQTDYTFEYKLGLAPDINITLDKSVTLPYYRIQVTDEMVNEQDQAVCARFGEQEEVQAYVDRAILRGDIKELGKEDDFILAEGVIVAPWTFKNTEEAAKFNDAKVNDTIVYNPWNATEGNVAEIAAMLNISQEQAQELKGDFAFTINTITANKPAAHSEELYKKAFGEECTTEEQYFDNIRKSIESQLLPNSAALFERQTRKTLAEQYGNFTLPVEFLKEWLVRRNDELNAETIDEEFTKGEPYMRWEILSGEIARKLDVKVTEDDLKRYATHIAARQFAQYGMANIDEALLTKYAEQLLENKDYRHQIFNEVSNANLFEAIGNAVTVDEKTVSLDEFKTLLEAASN